MALATLVAANRSAAPVAGAVQLGTLRGSEALLRLLRTPGIKSVLDIGSGTGEHADIMRKHGIDVTTISMSPPADFVGDFMSFPSRVETFDAIWACHVLEHQPNPGRFLQKCRMLLRPGGVLVVTVPPAKHNVVGGHLTLWNAGLLLYNLIVAGFDCRAARVGTYGYNISVIVTRMDADLPALSCDHGDIDLLSQFFPVPVTAGFDGELPDIAWTP